MFTRGVSPGHVMMNRIRNYNMKRIIPFFETFCRWYDTYLNPAVYWDKLRTDKWGHFPNGVSQKNLRHYAQIILSGEFKEYDGGHFGNMRMYGQRKPPVIDMTKIQVPIALFVAKNDTMAPVCAMTWLKKQLDKSLVYYKEFRTSHLGFQLGNDYRYFSEFTDLIAQHAA